MFTRSLLVVLALVLISAPVQAGPSEPSPEMTVETFYSWYLHYIGTGENFRNPMVDRAYHSSDLLTPEFIVQVDAFLAEETPANNYDPFLCAQDVPRGFGIHAVNGDASEDAALVEVVTSFAAYHGFSVDLVQRDGAWLIDGVTCQLPRTPEHLVQNFYVYYLTYNAWDGVGERPNALVDKAFRHTNFLSEGLVERVDSLLASFDKGGFDPFLCAQDLPTSIDIITADIDKEQGQATLMMETSFEAHGFAVQLELVKEEWYISDIICASES